MSGEIKEVLVEVGDEVKVGDPIAIIDDELLQLDLRTAEVALRKAQLDLAKMEEGARDGVIRTSSHQRQSSCPFYNGKLSMTWTKLLETKP